MDLKDQEAHDRLLADMPSGVNHDSETCPYCLVAKEGDMSKEYTEDELKAAVAEALAAFEAEKSAMAQAKADEAAKEQAHADALAQKDADAALLQGALDTATVRAEALQKNYDDLVAFLEGEVAADVAKAELETRKAARIAAIKEVANFSDEKIAEAIDRWVAMSDEDFEALLEVGKAVKPQGAATTATGETKPIIPATAMTATRDEATNTTSLYREIMASHLSGNRVHTV